MATTLSDMMLPSSSIKEKTPAKGNNNNQILMDQQKQASYNQVETSDKQDQDHHQAASTTPRSSSPTNSTTSSGKTTTPGANQGGGTHITMGKFKDKRPEPLNLNPNLNQEIPLDLSVKSAGNMPSGRSVNTLETPRIFWLDNEALLIKPRLYSSSTSASQRVRLSSLAGDSPPITPNTPFMDLVCSPIAKTVGADNHSNSASMSLDSNSSLHSLMSAQYTKHYTKQQQRAQFDDNLFATANKLTPTNRFLVHHHHFKSSNEIIKTPRRSCSTDNLTSSNGQLSTFKALRSYGSQQQSNQRLSLQQHNPAATGGDGKKNHSSISPLAINNLSSFKSSGTNRFSYSGQQIANCNGIPTTTASFNDDNLKRSLAISVTTGQDQLQSSDNMRTIDGGSGGGPKALTPTSLANATANLLNIHLNSPTNLGPTLMEGLTSSTLGSITSLNDLLTAQKSPTDQNMDPLISAAYYHQQQRHINSQILRSSLTGSTSSSTFGGGVENLDNLDKHHHHHHNLAPIYCHHQTNLTGLLTSNSGPLTSLSSSTTLNTPTLVSPSLLKSGSSICFLPSPLSPMSSVFELPSPLLMFPPPPTTCPNQNPLAQVMESSGAADHQAKSNSSCSPPGAKTMSVSSENQQLHEFSEESRGMDDKTSTATITTTANVTVNRANRETNSEANLSLLVTSAIDKQLVVDVDDEVSLDNMGMEIDTQDKMISGQNANNDPREMDQMAAMLNDSRCIQAARPATVIPRILVSDSCLLHHQQQQQARVPNQENHQKSTYREYDIQAQLPPQQHNEEMVVGGTNNNSQTQCRIQRDMVGKRALSPQSFRARVSVYHNERHESSSAPPDVYQTRARSKIKSAAEPSVVHGALEDQPNQSDLCTRTQVTNHSLNVSPTIQANYHCKSSAPYPTDMEHWQLPTYVGQQQQQYQQQCLSIKAGGLRPSSAEPLSRSQCSSGEHLGDSSLPQQQQNQHQHFDVAPSTAHHHSQHLQNTQPHQHQISSLSNIFSSHSEQHLRCSDRMDPKSSAMSSGQMSTLYPHPHHQFHSASAGELNSYQMNCGPSAFVVGPQAPNNQQQQPTIVASFQQQQQYYYQQTHIPALATRLRQQQHQHPLPTNTNSLAPHNNNNNHHPSQSSMVAKIDHMIEQAPIPVRIAPSLSSNHLAQGHHHLHHQNEAGSFHQDCEAIGSPAGGQLHQQQQEPRALSAEVRAISRSESSCSSADFCFRSSSATTASKKYQCDQCAKAFTRSDMLTRHKRLHSGDRPFQCNECKQEFSRSDHLSTHMRTHTGEKPYKCKLCSYSACRKDMITRHMKVHSRSSPTAVQQMD